MYQCSITNKTTWINGIPLCRKSFNFFAWIGGLRSEVYQGTDVFRHRAQIIRLVWPTRELSASGEAENIIFDDTFSWILFFRFLKIFSKSLKLYFSVWLYRVNLLWPTIFGMLRSLGLRFERYNCPFACVFAKNVKKPISTWQFPKFPLILMTVYSSRTKLKWFQSKSVGLP